MKVGLVGNPNVGKSTIFNVLTGMHQHTGNWPGKTIEKASGFKIYNGIRYDFVDLPGTYSLNFHSKEEEVTSNFIYFDNYDALVIVCDATSLERNLNLVIQILEITNKVVIAINLVDEAKKKKIDINFNKLSELLGVPVIPTVARSKKGVNEILDSLEKISYFKNKLFKLNYDFFNEEVKKLYTFIPCTKIDKKTVSYNMLLENINFLNSFDFKYGTNLARNLEIKDMVYEVKSSLYKKGFTASDIETLIIESISFECKKIACEVVTYNKKDYDKKERIIDKYLTNKFTGTTIMVLLLFLVLWITIVGANYPSDFLYDLFFKFEKVLYKFLIFIHLPKIVINALVYGIYRVLAWVVAVMLPPMMIFFPLFTLLEDLGYLPRIAFNMDNIFKKCNSCGKQALTMIEGFGCNAVGVTGARIIDSPRERLTAILTNAFVPCNGRFPLLISLISMFLITNTMFGSFILTLFILFGIFITFIISKILSKTILKGETSSFTLELPPYRRPQIIKVIIRSIFDRSLFVLKRAVIISAPAGFIIWMFANIYIGDASILKICTNFLNPLEI